MRDVSFEQLVILAIFLLVGLVNFILDLLRKRGRTAQPQETEQDLAKEEEELELDEALWRERTAGVPPDLEPARVPVPPAPRVPSGQGATRSVVSPVAPRRLPARSVQRRRLRRRIDPREARLGVVLMTILGPCRGIEPPAGNGSRRRPRRERVD